MNLMLLLVPFLDLHRKLAASLVRRFLLIDDRAKILQIFVDHLSMKKVSRIGLVEELTLFSLLFSLPLIKFESEE